MSGATIRYGGVEPDALRGVQVLRTFGAWIGLSAVAGLLTWFISRFVSSLQTTNEPALLIVAEVYAALPIAAVINVGGWRTMRERMALHFSSWSDLGLSLIALVAALGGSVALAFVLSPLFGSPQLTLDTLIHNGTDIARFPTATPLDVGLILIRVFLLAGLAEELIYRGLLFSWLRGRLPATATVLITSLVFGLQHYYPNLILLAAFYGLALGWVRARTHSIGNTVIMHILADTLFLGVAVIEVGIR